MIQNPSNLYSGDAVRLDSSPYISFAIKLMAQKQAKDEALDKYFGEQLAKATPAGMRSQEVPALTAAKNKYQKYYMENKAAIRNPAKDGGKAWGEFNAIRGIMDDIISTSKAEHEVEKVGGTIFYDPEKKDKVEDFSLEGWNTHNQPAFIVKDGEIIRNDYDPVANPTGHKTYDLASTQYKFDWDKYNSGYGKGVTASDLAVEIKEAPDKDPYKLTEITKRGVSPDQVVKLVNEGLQDYNTKSNLQKGFARLHPLETWFDAEGNIKPDHLEAYNELNKIYKTAYPKDNINTYAELHAAMMAKGKIDELSKDKIEVKDNKKAIDERENRQAYERMDYASRLSLRNQLTMLAEKEKLKLSDGTTIEDPIGILNEEAGETIDVPKFGGGGIGNVVLEKKRVIPVEAIASNLFPIYTNRTEPDPITLPNGKKVWEVDPQGNLIGKNGKLAIDRAAAAIALGKYKTKVFKDKTITGNKGANTTGGTKTNSSGVKWK